MAPRTKVEKRENSEDGKKYSEEEFKEFYGAKAGAKWWKAAAPGAAAAPSGKACTVCGNTNHTKADCKFKDKECSSCGKTGHLAKVCRSGGAATTSTKAGGKACTVCGKDNHVKADCKLKDKECSNCGKVGHIAKVCRQGEKATGGAKPKAKAKAKAKVAKERAPRVLATEGEISVKRVARVYRGKVKDEAAALALDGLVNELRAKLVENRKEKTKGFLKVARQVCKTEWSYELTVVWRSFDDFTAYKTSDFRKEVNGEFEEKAKPFIDGAMYSGVRVYDEL